VSVRRLHIHNHNLADGDTPQLANRQIVGQSEPDIGGDTSAGVEIKQRRRLPVCYCCSCVCAEPVARSYTKPDKTSVELQGHTTIDLIAISKTSGGHRRHHRKEIPRRTATLDVSSSISTDPFHSAHPHRQTRLLDSRLSLSNNSL